jgi:hypothetical protein
MTTEHLGGLRHAAERAEHDVDGVGQQGPRALLRGQPRNQGQDVLCLGEKTSSSERAACLLWPQCSAGSFAAGRRVRCAAAELAATAMEALRGRS